MGNLYFRGFRFAVLVCLMGLIFCSCGPTKEDIARMTELAKVKKIALVCFVGKSKTNPQDTTHEKLTKDMFAAFEKELAKHSKLIELLPYDEVKNNAAYSQVTAIKMPKGAVSGVEGLTYIKHGIDQGFDSGPLISSLKVDALLLVVVHFGAAVRQSGSTFYITADVRAVLITPPENKIWGKWDRPFSFEQMLLISAVTHPELVASVGAKWIILSGPSEEEYAEITKIAIQQETTMPKNAGEGIVKNLIKEIQEAREYVSNPK